MVKLTCITTRAGDQGETSLANGLRLPKTSLRIATIGAVDEVNAALGVARLYAPALEQPMLERVQHDLFDMGADLSTPLKEGETPGAALRMIPEQVSRLEEEITAINGRLPTLESFLLPGGTPAAAYLHQARTLARRAERTVCFLKDIEQLNPEILRYLNRLSDHLFVLARFCNASGHKDTLWKPGMTRKASTPSERVEPEKELA